MGGRQRYARQVAVSAYEARRKAATTRGQTRKAALPDAIFSDFPAVTSRPEFLNDDKVRIINEVLVEQHGPAEAQRILEIAVKRSITKSASAVTHPSDGQAASSGPP